MIQILGLRSYIDNKTGRTSIKHAFFQNKWVAESVEDLLLNHQKYVDAIPEIDRWNIFFTVGHCAGVKPRDFSHQDILPIDIDGMGMADSEAIITIVIENLRT